jgi:hypothetical protein
VDLVLGLSITSAAVRLVLVEGATGDGDTVDHDVIELAGLRVSQDASENELVTAVIQHRVIAAARRNTLHSIGVTWTAEAALSGSMVLKALATAGFEDFIAVSECGAADALAAGIGDVAGSQDVAVCIVEPEAAVVAIVNSQGALVDRVDRSGDGKDVAELVGTLVSMLHPAGWKPDAIVIFGSAADLDLIVSWLRSAGPSPVLSAADADLALAKGAALAAARAMTGFEPQAPSAPLADVPIPDDIDLPDEAPTATQWLTSRVGALTSVLGVAVLTFVVSLSLMVGLRTTGQSEPVAGEQRQVSNPAPPVIAERVKQVPEALPAPPPEAAPVPEAAPPPVYSPMEPAPEAVAPEPQYVPSAPEPEYVPPAPEPAYVPPAPANVPAAPPPVYIPPNPPAYQQPAPVQQPRLRDRIIDKIPILNRFHEPQPYYP